jgi:sulfur carrier protein ThiS adenylyltransferase
MEKNFPAIVRDYLSTCTVGIAGCGGLGSTCAINLARAGVGKLVIADFDIVTPENLERQYYFRDQVGKLKVHALKDNIERIDPSISVKAFDLKLCSSDIMELFAGCDIIVEAFDRAEMKQMIIETTLNDMPDKHLVTGCGLAGWGKTDILRVERLGKVIVCGDQVSEVAPETPLTAPRVGIVANMEANEVIELLMQKFLKENEDLTK